MWAKIKQDFKERFLRFESFNGAFVYIPWGAGFLYYGWPRGVTDWASFKVLVTHYTFGYNFALLSLGIVLVIWGLRKTFVNRIKQAAKTEALVQERLASTEGK